MYKRFFPVIISILFFLSAPALSVEYKKIDLDEAIRLSLANNLDLQSSRIELEIAKNDIKTANKLQNPEFNIFYNLGKAGNSEPQQIGLSEKIEIAKRGPRKNLAKSVLYKKEFDVKMAEFTLEMDVRETYVDLVAAKTVLNTLLEQEKFLKDLCEDVQSRHDSGKASQIDVIQAKMALNQIVTNINVAKTKVNSASNDFNKALNLKDDAQVLYDTKEDYLPDETVFISLKTPDYKHKMPAFENIAQRAVERRLDVKSAAQKIDMAKKNLVVVERQKVPDIELLGGYAYLSSNHSDSGSLEPGAYVGANLNNIPVLYTYKPEIKNAKLLITQAEIEYDSAKNKALKDLNSAYTKFLNSQANLIFYKQRLIKDSEEMIKIAKQSYLSGKSDFASVISVEQAYNDILTNYITSLADYYTDWIDFLREVNSEDFSLDVEEI